MKQILWLLVCSILSSGCVPAEKPTEPVLSVQASTLQPLRTEDVVREQTLETPSSKAQRAESLSLISAETKSPVTENTPKVSGEDSPFSYKSFLEKEFSGTDFTVGNLLTDWGTHKTYYATYKSDGLTVSGTWHVPAGEGPFPVLILNHGYFPPEEYTNGYGFGREQKYFARQGYAVFHTDYRGYAFSDDAPANNRLWGNTGFSSDAVNAALALKEADLGYVDTNNMGLFGHSLGGGVTLNAALARPDLFKVGVMWGPVSSQYWDNFNQWRRENVTAEQTALFEAAFGSIDDPGSFTALSAFPYLDRLEVPLLIQHGTADESCPVEWSRSTVEQLQGYGKNFEYIEYEGYRHVFWNQNWDTAMADTLNFIQSYLPLERS